MHFGIYRCTSNVIIHHNYYSPMDVTITLVARKYNFTLVEESWSFQVLNNITPTTAQVEELIKASELKATKVSVNPTTCSLIVNMPPNSAVVLVF